MPVEANPSIGESPIEMPVESQRSSDQRDCRFERRSCNCVWPGEGCRICKPDRPIKYTLPGRDVCENPDDPTVRLVSMKAVEEFNRRNRHRNLRLAEILEARLRFTLNDVYDLILLATEEENVETKGPCTRSLTALKEQKAKAGRKRRHPKTVRLIALVTVCPLSKKIKVRVVAERPKLDLIA